MVRNNVIAVLGAFVLGALLVGSVAVAGMSTAGGTANAEGTQTIHVASSGQASAQPDKAVIRLAVTTRSDDATTARKELAENVSEMTSALAETGITGDQIRTVDYDIRQERRRPGPESDKSDSPKYVARQDFEIEVTDLDNTGATIDTAIENGANTIHNVDFTLSRETRRQLREEALEDAMDNARGQADTLASRSGLAIIEVADVNTGERSYSRYRYESTTVASSDSGTSLDSGPVTVTASVQVTYNATNE